MSNVVNLDKARRAHEGPIKTPPLPWNTLSFISKRKDDHGGFNYWDVRPTGSNLADCEKGAALAQEYLAFIGAWPTWGSATLLTFIVRDMIQQRSWSGVHAGFLSGVNHHAMAAAVRSRPITPPPSA